MGGRRQKCFVVAAALASAVPFVITRSAAADDPVPPPAPPLCVPGSLPITGLVTNEKVVTFTFDDGPSSVFTPPIIRAFQARGLHATFFILGQGAKHRPDLVRMMIDAGDEVGNHSYTHHYAPTINIQEMPKAQATLEAASGVRPIFYRHPGLNWSLRSLKALVPLGLCAISTNTYVRDWLMPRASVEQLCSRFHRYLNAGAIVLLHDGGKDHGATTKAVPYMLDYAIAQGYQVLGLQEFLALAGGDPAKFTYQSVTRQ